MSGPIDEVLRALRLLRRPGAVVEVRALGTWKTRSGYFDDFGAAAQAAAELDRQEYQVYLNLNEVDPALLARAANRVRDMGRDDSSTADRDVVRRGWLLVDLDPVRPSGVSATDAEKEAALRRADEIVAHLGAQGWPGPVVADSGNGYHLLYPLDLPNDKESGGLVKGVLEALAFKFDDDKVKVDTGVHNAARIVRLYGTLCRKGDDLPERPHRRSRILTIPMEAQQ